MNFSTLKIFQTVLQENSVTRAAQRLNRAQSNVTTRIRQLEEEMGVALFLREGKRMMPTDEGILFSKYAAHLLALAEEAYQVLHPGTVVGRLRIGSMESTAASRLPMPLTRFHQRYPHVELTISTDTSAALSDAVLERRLDCALVAPDMIRNGCGWQAETIDARLTAETVFQEQLMLTLPSAHPLIESPRQLQIFTLAGFPPGCSYRSIAQRWLQGGCPNPVNVQLVGSYHAMLACIAGGTCFGILPQSVLTLTPTAGIRTIPLMKVDTWLIRRHEYDTPAFHALHDTLRNCRTGLTER